MEKVLILHNRYCATQIKAEILVAQKAKNPKQQQIRNKKNREKKKNFTRKRFLTPSSIYGSQKNSFVKRNGTLVAARRHKTEGRGQVEEAKGEIETFQNGLTRDPPNTRRMGVT